MTSSIRLRQNIAAVLVGLAVTLAVAAVPSLAGAQAGEGTVTLRQVDALDYPEVSLLTLVPGRDVVASDVKIEQTGGDVRSVRVQSIGEAQYPVGVVFVIDTSLAMDKANALDAAKEAMRARIAARQPNEQFGIVSFATNPKVVSELTNDATTLTAAVDSLVISGREEASLRDGIRTALDMLDRDSDLLPHLVIVSASSDLSSNSSYETVRADVLDSNVVVFGVGVKTDTLGSGALQDLASRTGGTYTETGDAAALGALFEGALGVVGDQFLISYTAPSDVAVADLTLKVGDASAVATFNAGTITEARNLTPRSVGSGGGASFLEGTTAKYVGAAAALVAVTLLVWGVLLMVTRDRSTLETVLQPYADGFLNDDDEAQTGMAETKLMQRAVDFTEAFAKRQGFLPKVEQMLEQADMPLRAAEALFFYFALAVSVSLVALLLLSPVLALIMGLLMFMVPPTIVKSKAKRRRKKFLSQLPDTLQLLAGSLRAGYSLMQGVEAVSQEVEDPMGRELKRIVVESRLGRPLEVAMEDSAERMGSPDFAWGVMAIRIQREVGGNLAELLLTVAETMVHRERLRREVAALTAEGKMSAIVLGILPPGLGGAMYAINPEYMQPLFTERIGQMMLGGSILLALVGFYWMKKTIEIEV